MREIVHVQIGHCGNNIGKSFWDIISAEHGLDRNGKYEPWTSELQKQRIDVYFSEGADGRRVPRAMLFDFDCRSMNVALSGYYGSLFNLDNVLCGKAGTNNNWAKGYYSEGDFLKEALNIVRKEVEACDSIQGIQIVHAIGGGTGSGFGSLFARHVVEEYPKVILKSYTLIPSSYDTVIAGEHHEAAIIQPYNAMLTIPYLIDCIHEVFCINNEAVGFICSKLKFFQPKFDDMNRLISLCMSGITACSRFPCQLNANLRKLLVNMVPFPRLHFFVPGYVPVPKYEVSYTKYMVKTLTQDIFKRESVFISCDPTKEQFLTAAAIFRGKISPKDVDESMSHLLNLYSSHYVKWIPHNIKTAICNIATYNTVISATSLSNTTAIQQVFMNLLDQFKKMFERKSYLHWYIKEGMEESDFLEAQNRLLSLISEYQQCKDAKASTDFIEEFIPYVQD